MEKLWVVNREIEVSTAEERALELQRHCEYSVPKQKFVIMGSTGNLYNVTVPSSFLFLSACLFCFI